MSMLFLFAFACLAASNAMAAWMVLRLQRVVFDLTDAFLRHERGHRRELLKRYEDGAS